MKKILLVVLTLLLVALILFALFPEQVIDLLPIDQSGWTVENGQHFYLNEKGDPLTGWQVIGGDQYYFDPDTGVMHTGWLEESGKRYHFHADGIMLCDSWLSDGGKDYYLGPDGALVTGWLDDGSATRYLDSNGNPVTGWQEIGGSRFYFGDDAIMQTGWLDTADGRCYLNENGNPVTGWQEIDGSRYYFSENGTLYSGWLETGEGRFYINEKGTVHTGWLDTDEGRYYLNADGTPYSGWLETDGGKYYLTDEGRTYTGWLELDGEKYYLKEDGCAAVGKLVINDEVWFFTSTGAQIYLVNPWNYIPEDYTVELTETETGHKVAAEMYDALMQFMADCEAAGHKPYLYSSYRTQSHQQRLFNNMLSQHNGNYAKAAQIVAVPGTSEHQLGLAVDITDSSYRKLNKQQEQTETQKWLMEHCWDYGFILRYPNEKSAITGIIYEPWHYRYVGLELAQEIKELGLCLEEYLDMLTNDGTTCGGKAN